MGTGIVFTVCIIKCIVALIFFSFRITRTSVDTDVLGWSQEVCVNKVSLYVQFVVKLELAVSRHFGNRTIPTQDILAYPTGAEVSRQFGTSAEVPGAEVSHGQFGTSAKMSRIRSVSTPS